MSELEIKLHKPQPIKNHYGYFPFASKLKNGQIIVKYHTGRDANPTEEELLEFYSEKSRTATSEQILKEDLERDKDTTRCNDYSYWFVRSKNGGEIWEDYGAPAMEYIMELNDGTIIGIHHVSRNDEKGNRIKLWRSFDKGETWSGPEYPPISGPDCSFGWMGSKNCGVYFHRSLMELDNGSILASAYTFFPGDKNMRIVIYRSDDGAKSFYYYSTVSYDANYESTEGMTEPVLERLENGDFICVMRTGSYRPMLKSYSSNNGATWSVPEFLGVDGVDPSLQLMGNGILACSFGRPGVWAMFSKDGRGRYWHKKTSLWDSGLKQERSCCYTSIIEVGPGKLMAFYSAPADPEDMTMMTAWDPKQIMHSNIWCAIIEVKIEEA